MKKLLKAFKLFGIAVTASAALLAGLYFYDTKAIANDEVGDWFTSGISEVFSSDEKKADKVPAEVKADVQEENIIENIEISVAQDSSAVAATEDDETDMTSVAVEESEALVGTEESDSTEVVDEAPATETAKEAPATEAPVTQAVSSAQNDTEAATTVTATEAPSTAAVVETTVAETQAPAPALQNIVYTNVDGDKFNFSSIEDAKAALNVPLLQNPMGTAVANKAAYAGEAAQVLDLINQYRAANGLATLTYNDTLSTAAMERAAENAYADWNMTATENGAKRHIRPNFQKASSIKDEYGFTGNWGENFGRYQENATEIVEGWKASPSHNALLLSGDYSKIGIGVAQDSEGYFYWIALFN